MTGVVVRIEGTEETDQRLRRQWGELLREHLTARQMNRKALRLALEEQGIEVTDQAISCWLNGQTAPRPSIQVALGKVFQVPARSLFPLNGEAH